MQQEAQLSQRDRAAGCVIVFAKSRRLELENNVLQTLCGFMAHLKLQFTCEIIQVIYG